MMSFKARLLLRLDVRGCVASSFFVCCLSSMGSGSLFVTFFLFLTEDVRMGCSQSYFVDSSESDFASSVICRSSLWSGYVMWGWSTLLAHFTYFFWVIDIWIIITIWGTVVLKTELSLFTLFHLFLTLLGVWAIYDGAIFTVRCLMFVLFVVVLSLSENVTREIVIIVVLCIILLSCPDDIEFFGEVFWHKWWC